MGKIKCECHNYGECDIADNKEILEVESTEMECPECHKPLYPIEETTIPWYIKFKKQLMLGGGVVAALAIVAGILLGTGVIGGKKEVLPPPPPLVEDSVPITQPDAGTDTTTIDTLLEKAQKEAEQLKNETEKAKAEAEKAKAEAEKAKAEAEKAKKEAEKNKGKEPKPVKGRGTIHLSYGTYTGEIKNGYPNGQGKLVYSTSRQISKYDKKGRTAERGDYVQGEFVNGFFTIGQHYNSEGELIESLNLGAPEGVYESK